MIIGNTRGYPSETPVTRTERSRIAGAEDTAAVSRPSPEFAAFLQMLVAQDPALRTGLAKQLPENGEGLLAHVLADGGNADGETLPTDVGAPAGRPTTLDAVRYGMIADARTGKTQPGTVVSPADARITQAVLARIAARHTGSVEELLAANDQPGAVARAALDNLLAKAGTNEGLSMVATSAASAALTAALSASAANVTTPLNDTAALDPELRTRLARVIERMQNEFGHDVTVVETARSQERQNYLFAQGRSAGGNIVTWTTDSAHTQGEAADVVVDGSWENPAGFARLQQVAKEEGLRTLGARDPGHLELPKDAWTTSGAVRVTSATTTAGAPARGIAQVATVASVASVATSAGAAQPGFAGAPGLLPGGARAGESNTAHSSSQQNAKGGLQRGHRDAEHAEGVSVESEESSARPSARAAASSHQAGTLNASPIAGETFSQPSHKFIGPVDGTEPAAGANAAARVEGIDALRAQQGSKPLSQMTLEVDGPNGGTQQITVDVRGNTVRTHINTDGATADRLRANVDELRDGLVNRGLQPDTVRISTQGASREGAEQVKGAADAMRFAGAASPSGANAGDQPGQRERSPTARDWDGRQAAREEQRAQQRDEQRREASQQGRSGPQYQEKQ